MGHQKLVTDLKPRTKILGTSVSVLVLLGLIFFCLPLFITVSQVRDQLTNNKYFSVDAMCNSCLALADTVRFSSQKKREIQYDFVLFSVHNFCIIGKKTNQQPKLFCHEY